MADKSNIGWTNSTWNVITGCKIKSPACRLCYAMDLAGTRLKNHPSRIGLTKVVNGLHVWTGEVRFNEGWLRQPLQWSRPREIFVVAHGDLFYEEVPDEWIDKTFAVMARSHWHTFQTLTKRSARMLSWFNDHNQDVDAASRVERHAWELNDRKPVKFDWPLPNVHVGVSAERQREADERIPDLLATPAAVRWVSAEPLLESIDFTKIQFDFMPGYFGNALQPHHVPHSERHIRYPKIDQIITGGESGRGKRRPTPSHPDWFRSVRDQCAITGTAYFHKQNGSWIHRSQTDEAIYDEIEEHRWPDGSLSFLVGTGAAGALLDGVAHEGRP